MRGARALRHHPGWDDVELISRDEATQYLLAVFDLQQDLERIRDVLEGGGDAEDDG